MRTIIIDGKEMTTRDDTHSYLAKALSLPDYYGRNLDALHDCLTDINEPTRIVVYNCDMLAHALGSYGKALLQVLNDSAKETGFLSVSLFDSDASLESQAKNKEDIT